jgi:hypothetical protein
MNSAPLRDRSEEGDSPFRPPRPPRRWQFGIAALLVGTTIVALLFALLEIAIGARKSLVEVMLVEADDQRAVTFVLLTIATPVAVLLIVSGYLTARRGLRQARTAWRDFRGLPREKPAPLAPPRSNPWDD